MAHIARPQDFGIKRAGCLQLLHIVEARKIERVLKDRHVRRSFAKNAKESPKIFSRRFAQRFIPDNREILATGKLVEPGVHRSNDRADSEFFVAQQFTHRFPLELCGRSEITPRHLHVERNETIARVAHEQNDLCTTKLLLRDQILAANPVPKIAFRPMLEQIVRKDESGDAWLAVVFRLERELAATPFAKISVKKRANPGASAFWD